MVVDDFLTQDALERLWRFCLDATVWYQVKRGYLGAYLVDGFATALALQIADELRARLPGIFGPHRLEQLWAYKYDSRLQGIATHADFAAVNVNFWVTPDEANRDPASGGLVIHKAHAPSDWAFRTYNADSARMAEFLAEAGDEPVTGALSAEPRGDLRFRSLPPHRRSRLPPRLREPAHQRHDALRRPRRALELDRGRDPYRGAESAHE